MQKQDKRLVVVINVACVASLLVVVFPLLYIAQYVYPIADDWSYGNNAYWTIQSGGGCIQVLQAAFLKAKEAYLGWDGRFANDFLDALQPGIWGENYYMLTPWILIGTLIFSELFFSRFWICYGTKSKKNALLWLPISVPMLIIQILFTPSPTESFYWYTGGMNYTFMYGLSLILIALFIGLGVEKLVGKRKRFPALIGACALSIFVGGGNFSTSLSTIFAFYIITVLYLIKKKYYFLRRTWPVTLTATICLVICLLSPGSVKGNASRMTGLNNPLYAVFRSLTISATNISIWTVTGGVLLMLLFVLPFIWKAVENMEISFKYPLLFSVLTFGVYASQVMPNIYVSGNPGGGRNAAIYYYSYTIWLLSNIFYWIGWFRKRKKVYRLCNMKNRSIFLLIYCGVVGIALVSFIYVFDKKNISSYKAYRDWKQGWAQKYAEEWEARLEILRDESVKEVVFRPMPVNPEILMYTDLQDEDGYIWVNADCAQYYGKISITISDEE